MGRSWQTAGAPRTSLQFLDWKLTKLSRPFSFSESDREFRRDQTRQYARWRRYHRHEVQHKVLRSRRALVQSGLTDIARRSSLCCAGISRRRISNGASLREVDRQQLLRRQIKPQQARSLRACWGLTVTGVGLVMNNALGHHRKSARRSAAQLTGRSIDL
jgi:hypothetical protein